MDGDLPWASRGAAAVDAWKRQVEAHHAQSIRIQQAVGWSPRGQGAYLASLLIEDPRRTGDPVLNLLYASTPPGASVLDVGAGAGRYALPLALHGHRVTVVEPVAPMLERLHEQARSQGITGISVVQQRWEDAVVEPADVVLAAHVVYGVVEIDSFVRKLQAHARERVLLPAFMEPPPTQGAPFWPLVHGEERHDLPGLPELLQVLWDLEIYPDLTMFDPQATEPVRDMAAIRDMLRHFLFVSPGTERDTRLEQAMRELVVEMPGGVTIRGTRPRRQGLLSWRPA